MILSDNKNNFRVILEKRGRGRSLLGKKTWKVRVMKLKGQMLEYYDGDTLRGTISLENAKVEKCTSAEADNRLFPFIINTKDGEKALLNSYTSDIRNHCIDVFARAAADKSWANITSDGTNNDSKPAESTSTQNTEATTASTSDEEEFPEFIAVQKFYEVVLNSISYFGTVESQAKEAEILGSSDFPRHGIRLSYILELLESSNAYSTLEGKDCHQFVADIIKPITRVKQCSFCEMLLLGSSPHVGPANVFLSYSWSDPFLLVISRIVEHYREKDFNDVFIWIDLFSYNQHKLCSYDFHWFIITFLNFVQEINNTLLVVNKWESPLVPLTRSWVIWELYCTFRTNSNFAIAMDNSERNRMFTDMKRNAIAVDDFLPVVDSERSTTTKKVDELCLHEAMRNSVGFETMNSIIHDRLKQWFEKEMS
jgi:hypothetical protein